MYSLPLIDSSLIEHMDSEVFANDEELSVCVLKNFRGMLEKPPSLDESVRLLLHVHTCMILVHVDVWGELAIHHPSSQGWASWCPLLYTRLFV